MTSHDPYAALRYPAFRWAFLTHCLTIFAMQMEATAVAWLVYHRTGSAGALGLAGLVAFLPVLLLSLPVGHLVDTRPRKTILIIGQFLLLLVAGGLAVCSSPNVPAFWMFVLLACEGVGNTFVSIARPVIMRDAIPAQVAENAASWSSLGRRIVSVGGPFLAGFLIETTGNAALAFSVSCIFLVLSIASDFPIRLPHRPRHEEAPTLHAITEGLRFMRRSPLVLSATLLDMFAVLLGGATALLPIFAKDILHVGPTVYGWLWASPSLGSAIMAFILTRRPPLKRAGHTLLLSVTGFGVMTIVFGLSRDVYLSFFALLMTGVFDALSVSIRSTILQLHVPDHLRGRVYGVNMIFVYSSNDLGEFESGTTAAFLGPVGSVVTGGIGAIIVAAIFGWRWPQLRTMRSLKPSLSEGHGSPSGV